jgi:hypothetical protein
MASISKDVTTTAADKATTRMALHDAPPPLHSYVLIGSLLAFFVRRFPSLDSIDEAATVDTFTTCLYLNLWTLVVTRLSFAALILTDCTYAVLFGAWEQDTNYDPSSKLKSITIPFWGYFWQELPKRSTAKALLTLSSFTMMAWTMLGIAFSLCGLIPILHLLQLPIPQWLLRLALLTFECSAPCTLLVSAVVKYAIWPLALQEGSGNSTILKNPLTLVEHNANSFMALVEIGLLGGLPVRYQDFLVAPLFGISYVLFTWYMMDKWANAKEGPQGAST